MNTKKHIMYLLAALTLTACAGAEIAQERFFWPPPPNPPRIEWLGEYSSQLDLKMTSFRRLKESVAGQDAPIKLKKPVEVRSDVQMGKMYVSDVEAGGVYVFDLLQSELRMLSTEGSSLSEKITAIGMTLDRDSNLYVLAPRQLKVLVFNSSEKYVRSISLVGICRRPVAIAANKNSGRLYIADVELNKIVVLDLQGTKLFTFGSPGENEGSFNKPVGIAFSSKGDVVVADAFNARVQVFSESGVFRRAFGKRGDGIAEFQLIKSVAVDPDDNIYVVDGRSHSVKIFTQSGDLLYLFGTFYSVSSSGKRVPGGFLLPGGIDIDSQGRIFVADQLNSRIQVFRYLPENYVPQP